MGFFKGLGNLVGNVAGGVIGGAVSLVGEAIDSDFIKEIGEGVYTASVHAGNVMGQAADGATGIVGGIITSDESLTEKGLEELGDAVGQTVKGAVEGISSIANNGCQAIGGMIEGDSEKVIAASKNLVKTAAIATLAIGVADYVGIIGDDGISTDFAEVESGDAPNIHNVAAHTQQISEVSDMDGNNFVDPHYVNSYYRTDGTFVSGYWRDGDGNPNTTLTVEEGGGYIRSNPTKA